MTPAQLIPFSSVAILGPGLMGGSLLLALASRFPEVTLSAWARKAESLHQLREVGLPVRTTTDPAEAVAGAKLVVICTPIETMANLARQCRGGLLPDVVVTDVGSVKTGVVNAVSTALGPEITYMSSHPMTGSEQEGFAAARADLYDGAPCILTAGESPFDPAKGGGLTRFWEALGMRTLWLDAAGHDTAVATISHLPHLAAMALVRRASVAGPETLSVAGSGWRDTTRVASGSATLWTEILAANREAVSNALEAFAADLLEAARHVREGDTTRLHGLLEEARQVRASRYPHSSHV